MMVSELEFRAAMLDSATDIPDGLLDGHNNPAGARFNVYRNNVAVSLTEALETGFPVIAKLLGEANFKPIAGIYLRQSPPQSPLMMHYGASFPDFLRRFEPVKHLGYLGDVADVEMALRQSYHAADSQPVAPDALTKVAPDQLEKLTFTLAPALQLRQSPWPIYDIWLFNTLENQQKPQARAQDILITRPEFDPEPHALPAGGADFISALAQGKTLGQAAEHASERATKQNQNFDLGPVLSLLLSNAAIISLHNEDPQ
ncbi:DNA-binding domain-containing protein [Cognatishimia sp. WU-CL00825]|uniref:DNA-binding domain-containing protein n=1 Tax=Cognatishimia sp. WU-CL00825 TaxID=3127658 RepID=UPI00310223DA